MIIWRPSIFVGKDSTTASSLRSSRTRLSTSIPICWWAISRPRKRSVILAYRHLQKANQAARVLPDNRHRRYPGTGNLISLTRITFYFFFCSQKTYSFHKELAVVMIRQTGGSALGLISTKSTPASSAFSIASLRLTIPSCSPSRPVKRTSWARISPLIRFGRAV